MAQLVRTLLVKENRPLTAQEFSGLGIHQKNLRTVLAHWMQRLNRHVFSITCPWLYIKHTGSNNRVFVWFSNTES